MASKPIMMLVQQDDLQRHSEIKRSILIFIHHTTLFLLNLGPSELPILPTCRISWDARAWGEAFFADAQEPQRALHEN